MPQAAKSASPKSTKLRRLHHKTVFSRSVDWELQGGVALCGGADLAAAPSDQAQSNSPPMTPSKEPHQVETFTLLSPEALKQVRQDLTGPVRARTPPRQAGTPPRGGARSDAAGAGTQASAPGRGGTPWAACCARPTQSGASLEPAKPVPLARSPARGRRASHDSSAGGAAKPVPLARSAAAGAPMPGLQRMTQSCDWESRHQVRARKFGRETEYAASRQEPNILRDASTVLQEIAETMREITEEDFAGKRSRRRG